MGILSQLTQYGGSWDLINTVKINPKTEAFNKATVVENTVNMPDGTSFDSISICFHMNAGTKTYLRLSSKSALEVGDEVDINSIQQLELSKDGENTIYRADGKLAKRE